MPDHDTHGTYRRGGLIADPDQRLAEGVLLDQLDELRVGDLVVAEFENRVTGARWTVYGSVTRQREWMLIAGAGTPLWHPATRRVGDLLVQIVDRTPAALPYAAGADRNEPQLGDVVEGVTPETNQRRWLFMGDGWFVLNNEAATEYPWWATSELPQPLRLVQHLQDVAS